MNEEKKFLRKQQKELFKKYEKLVGISFLGSRKRLVNTYSTIEYDKNEIIKHYNDKLFPQCDRKWAEEEYQRTLDSIKNEIKNEYASYGILFGMLIAVITALLIVLL